jgi:aminoglycoside 3-N-acetyltransferase
VSGDLALRRKVSALKRRAVDLAEREWHRARRRWTTIRPEQLQSSLRQLMGEKVDTLFVHISLSSCGWFTTGPDGVLDSLSGFCDTLGFPTHTYCYPLSPGELGPLFDPKVTPSQNGLLTEMFRHKSGVVRSIHATHSLAVRGVRAAEICADHYRCNTASGAGTPYYRLMTMRASALMFGVSFHSYTFFHTAEFESGSEFAYEHGTTDWLRVVDENGLRRDCRSLRQNRAPVRFREAGNLLERLGLVRRVQLALGALLFVPDVSKVHDFLLERLRSTPDFLRQSCKTALQ